MLEIYAVIYLVGWGTTSGAVLLGAARLREPGTSQPPRIALSMLAGLFWPVLLLGLVQYGLLTAYATQSRHEPDESRRITSPVQRFSANGRDVVGDARHRPARPDLLVRPAHAARLGVRRAG